MSLSRRSLLIGTAAGAALAVLKPSAVLAAGRSVPFDVADPIPSDQVRGTLGVNIKTAMNYGVYSDERALRNYLAELRLTHVRDAVFHSRQDQWSSLNTLARQGIRCNVVPGARPNGKGGTAERVVREIADNGADAVESIEGPNEWNLKKRKHWAKELRKHQRDLARAVRRSPEFSGVPVVAPALGRRRGYDELGDLRDVCDIGNIHLYSGGRTPTRYMDEQLQAVRAVSGGRPVFVTECGFHTALRYRGGHLPSSEWAAAVLMPRMLMEYVLRGVPRVFVYELFDQGARRLTTSRLSASYGPTEVASSISMRCAG